MWDRPDVLNGIAGALFAAAFLLVAYAAAHYAMRLPVFPLHEVRITNALAHVTPEQLEAIVGRELHGNFFTVDLESARSGFEKLPWVRNVNVRRQWPDRLDVTLEEHVALGRWGGAALVNTFGELFTAAADGALPLFVGPPGSAKEIAIQYVYFQRNLSAISQTPVQIQVSARRAWQVRLASGVTLELGREDVEARLGRFISVYARTVGRLQRRLTYIDLRYANGFAVGIPELAREPIDKAQNRKLARAAG
ncbi:MAG: cell division protein FtsQ/DivIB [Burkholderiales bacterium]